MVGSISPPDPMLYAQEFPSQPMGGNKNLVGKTLQHPSALTGNIGTFICCGQSNAGNTTNSAATLTNPTKIHNLNFYDGGLYAGADPLLGCQMINATVPGVGSVWSRMADKLVSDGKYDHVVLVPTAIGATSVNDWLVNPTLSQRIVVAARRARELGLTISGLLWLQGETDRTLGTSQAAYQSAMTSLIGLLRADGNLAPWLIAICSYQTGLTSSAVQAAQAAMPNGVDIFAGANCDSVVSAGDRQSDNTHFTDQGAGKAANLWAAAIEAAL
jgi:hypothetical protein